MIAVIQRVKRASVKVNEKIVSEIGKGILCFIAVVKGDTEEDAEYLVKKIPRLRIFEDENGKMNKSLIDIQGEILLVSQFTLVANLTKGLRPGFDRAETPSKAQELIELMIKSFTYDSIPCKSGIFAAHMQVELVNDGPATFILNTEERRKD